MSISENIFYLKDDGLFRLEADGKRTVNPDEVIASNDKTELMIDDKYFFYIGMDNISVSGRKLRDIAANYLSIIFPGDMVKTFGICQVKGLTVIYILSDKLIQLIKDNQPLFTSVKRISTPFLELAARYEDFVFGDGVKYYNKSGSSLSLATQDIADHITAMDLIDEMQGIKVSMRLPGVNSVGFSKIPLLLPIATLVVCYLMFVIGGVMSAKASSRKSVYYEEALKKVYTDTQVIDKKDPKGILISKVQNLKGNGNFKKVTEILADVSSVETEGIILTTLSLRDKIVRVDGTAQDFAQVEAFKKNLEEKVKASISADDTRKTEKGVTFVMRYEQ